jgi:four helix bundle protein
MSGKKRSPLKVKSFKFASRIIKPYTYITETKKEYILSKQLLRSRTAVGAVESEAQNAESKLDFIHKIGIAQKECDESRYWLKLLREADNKTKKKFESMVKDATELLKMI